jgi:hypothetical protein
VQRNLARLRAEALLMNRQHATDAKLGGSERSSGTSMPGPGRARLLDFRLDFDFATRAAVGKRPSSGDCPSGRVCDTSTGVCGLGGECGEVEFVKIAPNVMILLDRSGSMTNDAGGQPTIPRPIPSTFRVALASRSRTSK